MGSTVSSDGSRPQSSSNLTATPSLNNSLSSNGNGSNTLTTISLQSLAPQENSYDLTTTGTPTTNSIDLSGQSSLDGINSVMSNETNIARNGTVSGDDFRLNLFGTYIYPFRWLTLSTLYSWLGPLSSFAMITGCVLPYVPQYLTIHKNRSCSGFSTYVCLTLLLANILRIAFWFGHPFESPLLIQSIIMILAQILLLELCVRTKRRFGCCSTKRTLFSLKPRHFWRWTDLASYLEFLFILSALLGTTVYFLINCKPFIEALGYCALVTESMLGLPQVIENYRNKSVVGMSLSMVLMWLAGDSFKTGYFIANAVPYQFWLCGILQITIDLLILFQVCLFRQSSPVKTTKEMMAL